METLYRKVSVKERLPNNEGYYFGEVENNGGRDTFWFSTVGATANTFSLGTFRRIRAEYWLEEISHPSIEGEIGEKDFQELVDNDLPPNFVASNCFNLATNMVNLALHLSRQHNRELIEICEEFCARVERGEVKSKYTYAKMKQVLWKYKQ